MIRVDACHFVTIIPRTDKSFTCVIGEIQPNLMTPSCDIWRSKKNQCAGSKWASQTCYIQWTIVEILRCEKQGCHILDSSIQQFFSNSSREDRLSYQHSPQTEELTDILHYRVASLLAIQKDRSICMNWIFIS